MKGDRHVCFYTELRPYQLKLQAKELRDAHRVDASAHARLRQYLARLTLSTDAEIRAYDLGLREAQFVVAREDGFASWAALKLHAETATP